MRNPASECKQHADDLLRKLFQLHALSYALHGLGTELGEHLTDPKREVIEPIVPLAELSLRLCEEAEKHVEAIDSYFFKLSCPV
jgi:hypothetical protein